MKIAKEMFKELGYEYEKNNNNINYYNDGHDIRFNKESKCIVSYKTPDYYYPIYVSMKLLQAINKQVEELGWK